MDADASITFPGFGRHREVLQTHEWQKKSARELHRRQSDHLLNDVTWSVCSLVESEGPVETAVVTRSVELAPFTEGAVWHVTSGVYQDQVRACMRVCMHACVHACVRTFVSADELYHARSVCLCVLWQPQTTCMTDSLP